MLHLERHEHRKATVSDEPNEVVFVCIHNSGRSRMAESFFIRANPNA